MTDTPPPSSARIFVLATCLVFATQLGIALDLPSLATIAREMDASQRMMELSVSAYVVGVAVPILLWGVAADRFGRRATLNVALVLFVASSLLLAFADDPGTFVALRFVQGFGGGGCSILGRIIVRDAWSGEDLARRVAILSVSFIVAIGGGQFVGALLEQYGSWRMGFVLLAALASVSAVVSRSVAIASGRSIRPLGEMFGTYVGLMKEPQFLYPTLAGGFSYAALLTFQQASPFLLEGYFAAGATALGNIGLMTAIAYFAGALAVNRLVARTGLPWLMRAGAIVIGGAGAVILALALGRTVGLELFVAVYCAISFGQAVIFPTSMTLATSDVGTRGSYATALCSCLQQVVAGVLAAGVALFPHEDVAAASLAATLFGIAALALSARGTLRP